MHTDCSAARNAAVGGGDPIRQTDTCTYNYMSIICMYAIVGVCECLCLCVFVCVGTYAVGAGCVPCRHGERERVRVPRMTDAHGSTTMPETSTQALHGPYWPPRAGVRPRHRSE
jgi:hypothetical protein